MSENNPYCGSEPCPVILSSSCVFYQGKSLIYLGINTNDSVQTVIEKINSAFKNGGLGYAFTNGVTQTTIDSPVELGGDLLRDTVIGGNYKLTFIGNLQAAKFITTGGTASQFVKGDGSLDNTQYQPIGNYLTALSGDGIANGPGSAVFNLSTVNANPGVYGNSANVPIITVDAKGRVTNLTTTPLVYPSQSVNFIGDVVGSGLTGTNISLSLQNVNPNVYNSITLLKFSVDGKGRITGASPITNLDLNAIVGYDIQAAAQTASQQATIATQQASIATQRAVDATASATTATTQANLATAQANQASISATNAATSASSALSSKNDAQAAATTATNQATTATTQAGIATSQANIATTQANNAASSASSASSSASTATTQAGIATTQAGIATTQASNALTSANNALSSANSATSSASTATTQAGIATTQAGIATTQANNAIQSNTNTQALLVNFFDPAIIALNSRIVADMGTVVIKLRFIQEDLDAIYAL